MARICLIKVLIVIICVASVTETLYAAKTVKILTWFGYLHPERPILKNIETKCQAKISIDEFYSNSEFLDRVKKAKTGSKLNYDILIYGDTISHEIDQDLKKDKGASLSMLVESYDQKVKSHFEHDAHNKNTAIFQISLTGFLWNRQVLNISAENSLRDIFKKADDKIVVLLDDHTEIQNLLHTLDCEQKNNDCASRSKTFFPDEQSLRRMVSKTKLIVASDLAGISKHPNFAFAYIWSGEGLKSAEAERKLEFMIHPELSHVSMDMLALVGESPIDACVARELGGKQFLESVSRDNFYFSPYGSVLVDNSAFASLQKEFFKDLDHLQWLQRLTPKESREISNRWQALKLKIGSSL
jgi:hypothetical protein